MADKKISALTAASTPLAGTEVLPIVQGGSTVKVSISDVTAGRAVVASSYQVGTRLKISATHIADAAAPTGNNTGLAFSSRILPCDSAGTLTDNTLSLGTSLNKFASIHIGDNLVIGTAGKGIDFSANTHAAGMTSELLNDYEEGTWTPALGGTWSTNPTALSGTYRKVGSVVYVYLYFVGGAKATATNGYFTGLPYTTTISGTAAITDSDIVNRGSALFANTDRVWVSGNTFSGGTHLSGFYFT